ncbi:hypothetical protein [Bartonella sp. B17]
MDDVRACFKENFSSLYIFIYEGRNIRVNNFSKEGGDKEGKGIVGQLNKVPIAISILVKNPEAQEREKIYFKILVMSFHVKQKKQNWIRSLSLAV